MCRIIIEQLDTQHNDSFPTSFYFLPYCPLATYHSPGVPDFRLWASGSFSMKLSGWKLPLQK